MQAKLQHPMKIWTFSRTVCCIYRASIQLWVLKTAVTILGEIISDYHKLQGILLLLISVSLLWVVVRHVPYYSKAVNCFQGTL